MTMQSVNRLQAIHTRASALIKYAPALILLVLLIANAASTRPVATGLYISVLLTLCLVRWMRRVRRSSVAAAPSGTPSSSMGAERYALFGVFCILFLAGIDLACTVILIGTGKTVEMNLIARMVIQEWGWASLIALKMCITFLPAAILYWKRHRVGVQIMIHVISFVYMIVATRWVQVLSVYGFHFGVP
jgi:hypothetical protein